MRIEKTYGVQQSDTAEDKGNIIMTIFSNTNAVLKNILLIVQTHNYNSS